MCLLKSKTWNNLSVVVESALGKKIWFYFCTVWENFMSERKESYPIFKTNGVTEQAYRGRGPGALRGSGDPWTRASVWVDLTFLLGKSINKTKKRIKMATKKGITAKK